MNIIIIGSSNIALHLATDLAPYHDIVVIDDNRMNLQKIGHQADVKTIIGQPAIPSTLKRGGANNCDVIIALHDEDEINMVACQIAFSLFKIKLKIALICSDHYLVRRELFGNQDMPIDVFINPERPLTDQIIAITKMPAAKILPLIHCEHLVCDLTQHNKQQLPTSNNHKTIPKKNKEEGEDNGRHNHGLNPNLFICPHSQISELAKHHTPDQTRFKNILIAGASSLAAHIAIELAKQYNVKVIEPNIDACESLAIRAPDLIVLHGQAFDEHLLHEEAIDECDIFFALSDDDENNIMAALQAKRLGAKYVVTLVNHSSYQPLVHSLSQIDHVVSFANFAIEKVHWALAKLPYQWINNCTNNIENLLFIQSPPDEEDLKRLNIQKIIKKTKDIKIWHVHENITQITNATPLIPAAQYIISFNNQDEVDLWNNYLHNISN